MVLNPNSGEPYVQLSFKGGEKGIDAWRAAAKECYGGTALCPTRQLAIVLDGRVLSAPTVNDDFSDSTSAQITGSFSRNDAKNLATALRYGALPVELERQQAQEVSATVGKDALNAGVVAGIIGLAIVTIYILLYYRIFGAVAITSLALSFGLMWAIISWLGASRGLALTLSGVVGIIVSIGVSIDSNIVYFEVIKDDMHTGRNLRSSAERAFRSAIRTIIRADSVSLIAAALLYWLTVGSVRGFAFYLGLATLLDLLAAYFFMRPAVLLLARTRMAERAPDLVRHPPAPRPTARTTGRSAARALARGGGGGRMNAVRKLLRNENDYNFVKAWRVGLIVSAVLMVVSLLALSTRGLNWGIDFEGGTSWELPANGLSVGEARDVMRPFGQAAATIQTLGGDTLRVRSEATSEEDAGKIRDALAAAAKIEPGDVAVTTVGPTWGCGDLPQGHPRPDLLLRRGRASTSPGRCASGAWRSARSPRCSTTSSSPSASTRCCRSRSRRRRSSPSSRSSASRSTTRSWCSTRCGRTHPRSPSPAG